MFRCDRLQTIRLPLAILASVLVFGLVSAVSAESDSSSTQTEGSVTLADSECTVSVRSGDMDFGAWAWDGTAYQSESGDASSVVLYQVRGPRDGGCQITIQTAGLVHTDSESTSVIGPEHFAVDMVDRNQNPQLVYFDDDGTVSVPWGRVRVNTTGILISLMSVPNDIPIGKYEGEFIFTISVAP